MPFAPDAVSFAARIQDILDGFLAEQRPVLAGISDDLIAVDETLAAFLAGGKRLRPSFCYWGWRGAGGDASDGLAEVVAMRAAASLELLQASALIHDDVMDASETRRGLPAVHVQFADRHRTQQWLGSDDAFGTGAAILIGDLCLAWADVMLCSAGIAPLQFPAAKGVYDQMRTELMAGQYLDLLEQARGGGSVERARTVVHYKTTKYTIERPLHLGGAIAGADPAVLAAYSAYGIPLGEAFQLRDDILGVFGDPQETGKPAGNDLREGKRTVLVAAAFERSNNAQRDALRMLLGNPDLDDRGVTVLRDVIRETGALDDSEQRIEQLRTQALDALRSAPIAEDARAALAALADASTRRSG